MVLFYAHFKWWWLFLVYLLFQEWAIKALCSLNHILWWSQQNYLHSVSIFFEGLNACIYCRICIMTTFLFCCITLIFTSVLTNTIGKVCFSIIYLIILKKISRSTIPPHLLGSESFFEALLILLYEMYLNQMCHISSIVWLCNTK